MRRFSVADSLPHDLIHHILSFLTTPSDFATISLLNKHWYQADATYRRSIKVFNCFAVSPTRLTRRFYALTSLTLITRPNLVDDDKSLDFKRWVAPDQWIESVSSCYKGLRVLKLKRFVLSHQTMLLISTSFPHLRSLVLVGCEQIPRNGLSSVVRSCRYLEVLELRDCYGYGMIENEPWLIDFPERCDSLVSLSFVNVNGGLDVTVLERVISGCCNLKCLKFGQPLQPEVLTRFLKAAPQLVELGFGAHVKFLPGEIRDEFVEAVTNCVSVQSLSGAWTFHNLILMNSLCLQLLFLDLTKLVYPRPHGMADFIQQCHNLQRLWVLNSIGDRVLRAVGKTCAKLQELKVTPSPVHGDRYASARVTDTGLTFITFSCHKLQSVTFISPRMSNDALVNLARLNPDIRKFKLTLLKSKAKGVEFSPSLDEGFAAILESCRNLNQLSIRNAHVTEQVFFLAGMYGSQLKKLSVEFSGNSNGGVFYALNFCLNLKQLVVRCPFGDAAFLAAAEKLKNLQFVWVYSDGVTMKGTKFLREISKLRLT